MRMGFRVAIGVAVVAAPITIYIVCKNVDFSDDDLLGSKRTADVYLDTSNTKAQNEEKVNSAFDQEYKYDDAKLHITFKNGITRTIGYIRMAAILNAQNYDTDSGEARMAETFGIGLVS